MSIIGPITYRKEQDTEVPTLVASAEGVVVEIGPGDGNQVGRYDRSKITKVRAFIFRKAEKLLCILLWPRSLLCVFSSDRLF